MFFCSSSCHAARQRSIRLLGCLEGAVGTVRVLCLACPNLYIFGISSLASSFFSLSDSLPLHQLVSLSLLSDEVV